MPKSAGEVEPAHIFEYEKRRPPLRKTHGDADGAPHTMAVGVSRHSATNGAGFPQRFTRLTDVIH
jgi:hypothetical protein